MAAGPNSSSSSSSPSMGTSTSGLQDRSVSVNEKKYTVRQPVFKNLKFASFGVSHVIQSLIDVTHGFSCSPSGSSSPMAAAAAPSTAVMAAASSWAFRSFSASSFAVSSAAYQSSPSFLHYEFKLIELIERMVL